MELLRFEFDCTHADVRMPSGMHVQLPAGRTYVCMYVMDFDSLAEWIIDQASIHWLLGLVV